MKMGKSFNKSILFVLGIILVASAFSGCTESGAQTNDALGDTHEIYKLIRDGKFTEEMANGILNDDIHKFQMKNIPDADVNGDLERGENINHKYIMEWKSPEFQKKFGLMSYDEWYTEDGKLRKMTFMVDEKNAINIYDNVKNEEGKIDGKIDKVFIVQNGEQKAIKPESID